MAKKAGCCGGFDGLTCRMVIETKRVFDGCRRTDENITLTLNTDSAVPQGAEFASARVVSSELTGYTAKSDGDRDCIDGDGVIRFAVTYMFNGEPHTVGATYIERTSARLSLPENGVIPYTVEFCAYFNYLSGTVIGGNSVSVSGCLLRLIRVTAPVDVLVPTYGYCNYPPCTGCVCPGFDGNIFPSSGEGSGE